jgi:hypothetical protein
LDCVCNSQSSRRKGRQSAWTRYFTDHVVPTTAPNDINVRVRRLHRADFDVLQKLFQERPVWLRSALVNYLPNVGPTEFRAYF